MQRAALLLLLFTACLPARDPGEGSIVVDDRSWRFNPFPGRSTWPSLY